jgi:predicted transcriptional regulator of viral defense system
MLKMERSIEAYVSREIMKVFEGHTLVATNEALPGRIKVDFHLRDKDGADVFVEVSTRKIERSMLSKILNLYSSLSNMEPPLKRFELVIVGSGVDVSVKEGLEGLPIRLVSLEELGITQGKMRELEEEQRQLRIRKLSPEEARLVAKWEAEKKTVIRAIDVQSALHCSLGYAYFLLHNLERKRWLERIGRGVYQFVPAAYGYPEKIPPANALVVGAAFVEPYYFSYYTSNSHYGFTTQMPFTLFIATMKKKPNVEWQSVIFKFVTLSKHKFFGYRLERVFDAEVFMAEPEKSLVDSFDKPHYAGGIEQLARITWRGLAEVDQNKLAEYAVRMKSHALVQRLGFIIDFLARERLVKPLPSGLRNLLQDSVGKTPIYLDPRKPKTGSFYKEWRVVCNLSRDQLLSEIEVR